MADTFLQVGVDEAGRGPIAGPVSLGVVVMPANFNFEIFKGLKDSKKLSEKKREEIFKQIEVLASEEKIKWSVLLISNKVIDESGIVYAIRLGIERCFAKLKPDHNSCKVFLDGLLKAPEKYKNQETIIKGDEKIPVISLASICAKVIRDRYMVELAKKFPEYGFEMHKGYGTSAHYKAIKKHGISEIHRRTFIHF